MSTIDGPLGAGTSGSALSLDKSARSWGIRISDRVAARLGLVSVLLSGILLSLAAARTDNLLPETIQPVIGLPLQGLLHSLSFHLQSGELLAALALMFGGYVVAVRHADCLTPRAVLPTIAAFIGVVLLAPPLFSTDVFSYQEYARMFAGLHVNPYTNNAHVLLLSPEHEDLIYPYLPPKWLNTPTVYGPLFTLLSAVFQNTATPADIALSAFAYKTIAALSCGGIIYLLWISARLRGVSPVRAVAMFGLNPLIVLYGVGGGHNDLLMMLLATAGIWAVLSRRERTGGALTITAAAIKFTGGIFLPFALVAPAESGTSPRWRRVALGAAVALVICLGTGIAVFGTGVAHMLNTLGVVQGMGGWQTVAGGLSSAGLETASRIVSVIFGIAFGIVCCWLLWRVHRGRLDWLEGAGWATFWLLLSTSQIVPWYLSWLVVPVALCGSRRLWTATTCFSGWVLLSTAVTYLPHAYGISGL